MSVENKEYHLLAVSKYIERGLGHYTMILYINNEFFEVNNLRGSIIYPNTHMNEEGEKLNYVFYYNKQINKEN
jgi:hypothetical protein